MNDNQDIIDRVVNASLNPSSGVDPSLMDEELARMRSSDWAEIFGRELENVEKQLNSLNSIKIALEKAYQLAMMMSISDDAKDEFFKSWKEMKENFGEKEENPIENE